EQGAAGQSPACPEANEDRKAHRGFQERKRRREDAYGCFRQGRARELLDGCRNESADSGEKTRCPVQEDVHAQGQPEDPVGQSLVELPALERFRTRTPGARHKTGGDGRGGLGPNALAVSRCGRAFRESARWRANSLLPSSR